MYASMVLTADEHNKLFGQAMDILDKHIYLDDRPQCEDDESVVKAELSAAIVMLQKCLEAYPENWAAQWSVGKGYQRLGDHEAACRAFLDAHYLNPAESNVILRELVLELLVLGRYNEAVQFAQLAVDKAPNDPGQIANLAMCLLVSGNLTEASNQIKRAIELDPRDEKTTEGLSNTLIVWDLKTGERLHTLEGHTDRISAVVLSSEGRFAFSGSAVLLGLLSL